MAYILLCSNASSILLHLIVNELMSFEHFLLAGGHNIGCMYADIGLPASEARDMAKNACQS
jgi:hypothetical protein